MVGGVNSRKLGLGGGGNRSAAPIKRPSPPVRLSLGRGGPTSTSNSSPMIEESFSLVRDKDNPLNFVMAIKLVPDLVEEIKRAEAQGSTARIKFSAYPNSADGNVISVGGKNLKFSWAPEVPDLCDIYEERQSGEVGNGLLVESGTTWRKLSVQRELDESTHNHVKMRSEEAERKLKSRKAIVLDHQNSSMKNQMKQLAAVESNSWRNSKNRREPPSRNPKSETTQAIGSHKPLNLTTKTTSKGNKPLARSPLSFQPDHGAPTSSPFTSGNLGKGHTSVIDVANNTNKTKETHSRPPSSSGDKSKSNRHAETSPDLKGLIMSLLMENHSKGMSLKALERAIGGTMSCTARQIEPILKQIANYQTPGRYFLKQGADTGSLKKSPLESGSSPQIGRYKSPQSQTLDQLSTHDVTLSTRTAVNDEEEVQLRSTTGHAFDATEYVDILNDSPHLMDKTVSENNEGLHGSSSESRSDSGNETDGSDSSESESDASSSSKQASDEDVDIMSSDNEEVSKEKLQNSNPVPLKSPVQLRRPDSDSVNIGNHEKHDDHISDIVDIEKDSPMDNHEAANYPFPSQESQEPIEEIKNHLANYHERLETQVFDRKSYAGTENVPSDGVKSSGHERLHKGKSKKRYDDKSSDERPHNSKRLKGGNANELLHGAMSLLFGDPANTSSPDEPSLRPNIGSADQTKSTYEPTTITFCDQGIPTYSTFDSQQPAERFFEAGGRPEVRSVEKENVKHDSTARGIKHLEQKPDMHEKPKEETSNNVSGKSPMKNGRARILQREVSELELGEFREPRDDESAAPKELFGRTDSFKQLENKQTDSFASSRKGPSNKFVPDSKKSTPSNSGVREGSSKRKINDLYGEDHARTHSIATPTLNEQHQSSEHDKVSEKSSKSSKKEPVNAADQKQDHMLGVVSRSTKESKKMKASKVNDTKKRKDAPLIGVIDNGRKRRESTPLESPYNKFEKEKPELKGPIKDTSQYKDYVKEYQEKYESYCSLNKVLESYRDEFGTFGKDLETYKDRDLKKYHDILVQIKSSFIRCGEKHKRLKNIFAVLHEELKHLKQMIKDYAASYAKYDV